MERIKIPTSVNAEIIDASLEVRNVRANLGEFDAQTVAALEQLTGNHPEYSLGLLRNWQDIGTEHREVLFHGSSRNFYKILGQPNTSHKVLVLRFVNTSSRVFRHVLGTHDVQKLKLGTESISPFVREHDSSTSTSEQNVLQQEASLVAQVQIGCDDFSGNDQNVGVGATSKNILREIDGDQSSRATHTGKIIGKNILSHLEFIDNHGAQRWCGRKQGAIDNENIDVLRLQFCLLQNSTHNVKHNNLKPQSAPKINLRIRRTIAKLSYLCLLTRSLDRTVVRLVLEAADNSRWPSRRRTNTTLVQHTLHKLNGFFGKALLATHEIDGLLRSHFP